MLTPLDIENKRFPTKFKGYDDAEVDAFLDQLTIDYEKLYKENAELKSQREELDTDVGKYKNIEGTLQNTLIMAQTTADEVKKTAQKQADAILAEAQGKAKEALAGIEGQIILKQKNKNNRRILLWHTLFLPFAASP